MKNFKISTKLALSFALMIMILLVLGGIALHGSSVQRIALNQITQRQIPLMRSLNSVMDGVNIQAALFRNLLIFNSEDMQAYARSGVKKARADISEEINILKNIISSDEGISLLERVIYQRSMFLSKGDEFIALLDQNHREAALAMLETELRPVQLEYQRSMRDLLAYQTQRAEKSREQAEYSADFLIWEVLVASGIAIVIAGFLALAIIRSISRPLADAVAVADRVARGDLSGQITVKSQDETGQLLHALQRMQQSLVNTVTAVRSNAQGVASGSAQIAVGNSDLSGRTEEQASALEQTAASMEQLGATVKQNADNARQANQMAMNASSVAAQGGEVVAEVVETMKSIDESSNKIADIISVIDGIAFQTNILALNAAVEAARAGEQGRGFAVVASEVRALAGRSAEAAKEIKQLITTSVERVEQGSALVDRAGKTMTDVVTAIRRVTDIMGEISAASHEQSSGMAQIGEAVTQMDQTTQQNAALVEEIAAAASSLNNQAQSLVDAVAVFKLSEDEQAVNTRLELATGVIQPRLNTGRAQSARGERTPSLGKSGAITKNQLSKEVHAGEWEIF